MNIKEFLNRAVNLIFPNKCIFCSDIIPINQHACLACEEVLPYIREDSCMNGEQHDYDECISVFNYDLGVKKAILDFKFNDIDKNAIPLALYIYAKLSQTNVFQEIDYIIGVPMFTYDLNKRGYNQSYLLAENVAKLSGKVYVGDLLIKLEKTRKQHRLNAKERSKNLLNAIKINQKQALEYPLEGKVVLVIDDVITTGATMDCCSNILKKAGAIEVFAASIAKTETNTP